MSPHDREQVIKRVESVLRDPICTVVDAAVVARRIVYEIEDQVAPASHAKERP